MHCARIVSLWALALLGVSAEHVSSTHTLSISRRSESDTETPSSTENPDVTPTGPADGIPSRENPNEQVEVPQPEGGLSYINVHTFTDGEAYNQVDALWFREFIREAFGVCDGTIHDGHSYLARTLERWERPFKYLLDPSNRQFNSVLVRVQAERGIPIGSLFGFLQAAIYHDPAVEQNEGIPARGPGIITDVPWRGERFFHATWRELSMVPRHRGETVSVRFEIEAIERRPMKRHHREIEDPDEGFPLWIERRKGCWLPAMQAGNSQAGEIQVARGALSH